MPDNLPAVPIPDPTKILFDAIYEGDPSAVGAIIDAHPEYLTSTDWYYHHTPLHHAAYWNKPEIAEFLLTKGAAVDGRDRQGRTPLHVYSVHRTPEVAEMLLAHGADVHAKDKFGATPIFFAASRRIAELLVAHGADLGVSLPATPDARHGCGFHKGWTPLHAAAHRGDAALAEYLLSKGCDVNARTSDHETPLRWAIGREKTDVVAVLLEHGAKVNLKDRLGKTPLHWAIWQGDQAMVELLLTHGAKLMERDKSTPLHLAASANQVDVAEFLMKRGANVNATDRTGQTALHDAVWAHDLSLDCDSQKMAELLIDNGANLNAKDEDGWTPLHVALNHQAWPVVNISLARGAVADIFTTAAIGDVNRIAAILEFQPDAVHKADATGQTMLHWAAMTGKAEAVELLLQKESFVSAKDRCGNTALHTAADNGHDGVAGVLLNHRADVDALDENGRTPFLGASSMSHHAMVLLLAKRGADVNRQDMEGVAALHYAAWTGDTVTVDVLLNLKAKTDLMNKKGRTPLDIAVLERHKDLAEMLRQHGAKRARQL